MQAQSVDETAKAETQLTRALTDLRAVAENYPTLRATENFQQLSRNLSELEDEIQASRRIYNSNVQSYNTDIQQFPGSIIANQGGFTAREFFEIEDEAEREPVRSASTNRATPRHSEDDHGDQRRDPLDLRQLRVHLRPGDRRSRRRHPARHRLRGHPQGLVLPGLRGPDDATSARSSPARPKPNQAGSGWAGR